MLDITFFDAIGIVGAMVIVFAYFQTRRENWKFDDVRTDITNLFGAILLTISLLVNMNAGSMLIEIFWMGIALDGLRRNYLERRSRKRKAAGAS